MSSGLRIQFFFDHGKRTIESVVNFARAGVVYNPKSIITQLLLHLKKNSKSVENPAGLDNSRRAKGTALFGENAYKHRRYNAETPPLPLDRCKLWTNKLRDNYIICKICTKIIIADLSAQVVYICLHTDNNNRLKSSGCYMYHQV